MVSNVLVIADASKEALKPIMDTLQMLKKDRLNLRVILLSFLSILSKKNFEPLGPNTLFLLIQEEK
jgi:hypothetical protein